MQEAKHIVNRILRWEEVFGETNGMLEEGRDNGRMLPHMDWTSDRERETNTINQVIIPSTYEGGLVHESHVTAL